MRNKLKRLLYGYGIDEKTKTINLGHLLDELEGLMEKQRERIAQYFDAGDEKTKWSSAEAARVVRSYTR